MSNVNKNISQGIKVASWVFNGTPSRFGVQLTNQRVIALKHKQWNFLHRIWHKLKQPAMYYYEEDESIEFATMNTARK